MAFLVGVLNRPEFGLKEVILYVTGIIFSTALLQFQRKQENRQRSESLKYLDFELYEKDLCLLKKTNQDKLLRMLKNMNEPQQKKFLKRFFISNRTKGKS